MNLQDLVTVGPSEAIPGISAVTSAGPDVAKNRDESRRDIMLTSISSNDSSIMLGNMVNLVRRVWIWES